MAKQKPTKSKPAKPKKPERKAGFAATFAELAASFGKSQGTMKQWAADGAPPKEPDGYKLADWINWRMVKESTGINQYNAELAKLRLEKERFDFDKKRGKLMSLDDYTDAVDAVVSKFVEVCERGPSEIAPTIVGKPVAEMMSAMKAWFDARRIEIAETPATADEAARLRLAQ